MLDKRITNPVYRLIITPKRNPSFNYETQCYNVMPMTYNIIVSQIDIVHSFRNCRVIIIS